MAYDPAASTLVLFGGSASGAALGDTWTWDGTTWTAQCAACGPSARGGAALAPDPIHSSVVLFGGRDSVGAALGDTWTWDGIAWTLRCAACGPQPRAGASLAYNAVTSSAVLFGGAGAGLLNDLWIWDGNTWTLRPADQAPARRQGASFSYDPAEGADVLFGGCFDTRDGALGDTWLWDGQSWSAAPAQAGPSARADAALGIDSIGGKLVLFGGRSAATR